MSKEELDGHILMFFKQFRQYFFHERTGAPCVMCDEDDRYIPDGSFFGEKSKLIYDALVAKQGDVPSRE